MHQAIHEKVRRPMITKDYPSGWLRKSAGKRVSSEVIEVSPDHVIMMDGDSGHLVVDDDTDELLRPHVTPLLLPR